MSVSLGLKPGGWAIFNVPLLSAEGRIYALTELVNRRRINILPRGDRGPHREGGTASGDDRARRSQPGWTYPHGWGDTTGRATQWIWSDLITQSE